MDHSNNPHCNSSVDCSRPAVGVTHAKRFELSLEELCRIVERAKQRRQLQPMRREATLGEELNVPGFERADVDSIPDALDLTDLETLAHYSLAGAEGTGRAGLVICRVAADDNGVAPSHE